MKNIHYLLVMAFISSFTLAACTEDNATTNSKKEQNTDHVWKHQTDTLKTSKDVANQLQKSLDQQQQTIDKSH